ncbi:MAG: DNA alkylation repair protein [Candidatus Omnitrophica bacterium]|nr:DNA alkylation repair protein [Candidatus Omnitrophota bacterium]
MDLFQAKQSLHRHKNQLKAKVLSSFFKAGPGQYAEGDIFIGVAVPQIRRIAVQYQKLPLNQVKKLLKSQIHEERLLALIILTLKYAKVDKKGQNQIFDFYLTHIDRVNNWDLVDLTAPKIIGAYLNNRNRSILYQLAKSKNLWQRRIAIVSTFCFIRNNDFRDTLKLAAILINDEEDLIHKACGWMLREVGKRNLAVEERFLKKYSSTMPRTMLRYAIERFPEKKRKHYLKNLL